MELTRAHWQGIETLAAQAGYAQGVGITLATVLGTLALKMYEQGNKMTFGGGTIIELSHYLAAAACAAQEKP